MGANAVDRKSTFFCCFQNRRAPLLAAVKGLTSRSAIFLDSLDSTHNVVSGVRCAALSGVFLLWGPATPSEVGV